MDWLTTLAGETRTRLLRLVRRSSHSITELAASLGITDNAVRTHMVALERDGLVQPAGVQRSTGGKPARLYELTAAAEELFPKAYGLVLLELITTIREEEGEATALDLLRRVGRRLGSRSTPEGSDGAARVAAAVALLESIGGSVEVTRSDADWHIQADGCPLSQVVAESPDLCTLATSLVAEATGLQVTENCDRSGRPKCSFHLTGDLVEPEGGGNR